MPIYFRTEVHPVVKEIEKQGIPFQSFDCIYEQAQNFEEVYDTIAREILQKAQFQDLVYAVPGHPLVAEQSVTSIIEGAKLQGIQIEIVPAVSFLDVMFSVLHIDPVKGLAVVDSLQLDPQKLTSNLPLVLTQIYNPMVAAEAKLTLMEYYPDEHRIAVIRAAGVLGEEKVVWIPLYELDRLTWIDHLTSVYIPPTSEVIGTDLYTLEPLVDVMETLRSPGGCPWDIEQTHPTLKRYIVEEVYEVLEAIDDGDMDKLCDELGDLLLQIVFHARIAEENDDFTVQDVIDGVTQKMLRRHPHVFGAVKAETPDAVMINWEKIKQTERAGQQRYSRLDGVPVGLPALMRAYKIQAKAAKVGFDWQNVKDVWAKVEEETSEYKEAVLRNHSDEMEAEMGDLLFSIVNVARFAGIEPETALHRTNNKFVKRFEKMEIIALERNLDMEKMSLEELDGLWNEVKGREPA
jgi:tetrapyrrole methylase family protein/MazG family protein